MIIIEIRKIAKVLKSKPTIEGAGVHLKRALGSVGLLFSTLFY